MLLTEAQERELVNRLIETAQAMLNHIGREQEDPETGLVHRQCQMGAFLLVEHQRQKIRGGEIKTNGLDLWQIEDGAARKRLAVNYIPFVIRFFQKGGKAEWIDAFREISEPFLDIPLPPERSDPS